jgi:hypothetical protein
MMRGPAKRRLPCGRWLALCALLLSASHAFATPPRLALDVTPLLGTSAPEDGGWRSLLVRLENPNAVPVSGTVEVESRPGWVRAGTELTTSVPFSLAPRARVSLEVPTHGFGGGSPTIRVTARGANAEPLAETSLSGLRPADALVLDLATPSRLGPLLRNLPFAARRGAPFGGRARVATIGVSAATQDATTGDIVLPELPSGYASATLIVGSGRDLARLDEAERGALANFLLAGGALALSLDRPEDSSLPLLEALVGGHATRGAAPEELRSPATFLVPPDDPDQAGPGTAPVPLRSLRLAPSPELAKKLVGYSGGNLHDTPFGASASYGLGEVHLLAFDLRDPAALSDPWTRRKLTDLVRHAFDREAQAIVRHSASLPGEMSIDGVRRELDPNQTTRWTIVVSALVLLIYAGLAGPLGFYLAARKGRPLRALWQLPLWSAATLLVIVGLGLAGKGVSGRARRLSLVDAGAGMTRAAAVRFRGFYAASARELTVRAGRREHVLDIAGLTTDIPRTVVVDRDGPRLEGLRTKPWQTVLVREEGLAELSGGVSVLYAENDFVIKNRAARDLLGVVVRLPSGSATYFRRIKDGESVRASAGTALGPLGSATALGSAQVPLDAGRFSSTIDRDFPGLGRAWVALEPALGGETEWWPADVPVLLAALDGGEGKLTDSGLGVDYDRVLLRVVGTGGSL